MKKSRVIFNTMLIFALGLLLAKWIGDNNISCANEQGDQTKIGTEIEDDKYYNIVIKEDNTVVAYKWGYGNCVDPTHPVTLGTIDKNIALVYDRKCEIVLPPNQDGEVFIKTIDVDFDYGFLFYDSFGNVQWGIETPREWLPNRANGLN